MGFPGTISVKKFYRKVTDSQGTKWRRNIVENFNRLSRVHERYRQTDDRQTDGRTVKWVNSITITACDMYSVYSGGEQ